MKENDRIIQFEIYQKWVGVVYHHLVALEEGQETKF